MEYVEASGAMIASFLVSHSVARIALRAFFYFLKRPSVAEP